MFYLFELPFILFFDDATDEDTDFKDFALTTDLALLAIDTSEKTDF